MVELLIIRPQFIRSTDGELSSANKRDARANYTVQLLNLKTKKTRNKNLNKKKVINQMKMFL